MLGRLLFAVSLACSWTTPAWCLEFPYTAYVQSNDVYVRSGPGKNYYPTAKLRQGEAVEVYRHDPGGWYAIRPPQQSFSWISARQVDPGDEGLAVVNTPRAVARVGSVFSSMRDVIQVRLNRGERVELVEHAVEGDDKWFKIAPPAGEFRWIASKYISRNSPEADDAEVAAENADGDAERDGGNSAVRLVNGQQPVDDTDDDGPAPKRRAARQSDRAAAKQPVDRLRDIELDLSAMVAEEITVWSFVELRDRAERAFDAAPTAIERGQVRLALNKIDRFEEIKQRHDALEAEQRESDRQDRISGHASLAQHEEAAGPRFDGAGRLITVTPRRPGVPPYVLVDVAGQVVCYVTAAPGVNLRPYLEKQIGVNGPRGYAPELQKAHVNVQHVTLLLPTRR